MGRWIGWAELGWAGLGQACLAASGQPTTGWILPAQEAIAGPLEAVAELPWRTGGRGSLLAADTFTPLSFPSQHCSEFCRNSPCAGIRNLA